MANSSGADAAKDVSAGVMVRIGRHGWAIWLMGLGGFLFVAGMVGSQGGARAGSASTMAAVGEAAFLGAIVYGLISTFVNLRCPGCGASIGFVVSSLYAPLGVSDDFSPACRGCGATLLPPGARAQARARFRGLLIGMILTPVVAVALGLLLRALAS